MFIILAKAHYYYMKNILQTKKKQRQMLKPCVLERTKQKWKEKKRKENYEMER